MTSPQSPIFPHLTTRSTILIAGEHQQVRVDVTSALTAAAAVFVTFGAVRMVFTDPAVARALVTALHRPRSGGYLLALPEHFMLSPDRFAADEHLVTVNWSNMPQTSVVPGGAFDSKRRRHVHWVDVETGPLIFRFFDKAGHTAFVAELARTIYVARSVLLPADEKALALHGHS
ncbi:hypothetical protein NXT08_24640 (plasmid) [Rhodococcus pyridinivorans]|uniref:hypothetical protein n=1 Tax=Rhodococcus pyridinivorans TaxID=103816 RepID=UPI002164E443|nr:hypothetical protein [Rhodococcus pyridinivorans]UVT27770.1 hypothetical protein NXT08_24640 [Rhodococcus pyridinivorans]